MVHVYAFRHPETEWNLEGRIQGQRDIPLNENGRRQVKSMVEFLHSIPFTHIVSSDLSRSYEFADAVAHDHRLVVITDSDLRERNLGVYEGRPYNEVPHAFNLAMYADQVENGESLADVFTRLQRIPRKLAAYGSQAIVGVFSHGGVLAKLPSVLKKEGYQPGKYELLRNGAYHYFELNDTGDIIRLELYQRGPSALEIK